MILHEGEYAKHYFPVVSHPLDIPQRLKEIDERFFVMYHSKTQTYEIHVKGQTPYTYGCTVPYAELDARTLEHVRHFSADRTRRTALEVERHNERLDRSIEQAALDDSNQRMKEAIRYLDHHERAEAIPQEMMEG